MSILPTNECSNVHHKSMQNPQPVIINGIDMFMSKIEEVNERMPVHAV